MQDNSQKELKSFRELISNDEEIRHNCPKDEEFLMKFLRAKDLDVNSAMVALKKYIKMRQNIKNYNPESVRHALESGTLSILKHRDSQGRQLGLGQASNWDVDKISSEELYLVGCLSVEQAVQSVETQQNGIVLILDGIGLNFSHCLKLGFKQIAQIVGLSKGGFPVKFKEIHIVNEPKIFGILYSIGYPLLSEKLKKRVFVHGKNLDSLHKFLPREILPDSLGGDLSNDVAFDANFMPDLLSRDEYFKSTTNLIAKNWEK